MKGIILKAVIVLMTALLVSCASSEYYNQYKVRTVESLPDNVLPGRNETEIIIRNEFVWPNNFGSNEILLFVYIDDILTAQIAHAGSERIIVPNGKHTITVAYMGTKRGPIRFTANSERIIFRAFYGTEPGIDFFGYPYSNNSIAIFLEYVR